MKDWAEQLVNDISEIDNKCFNEMPLAIIISTGQNDNGDRYFDASVYTGEFSGYFNPDGACIAEYINAENLSELLKELNKVWEASNGNNQI